MGLAAALIAEVAAARRGAGLRRAVLQEGPAPEPGEGNSFSCVQWEDPSVRLNGFHFLPHGQDGTAVTKKLEQKCRKPLLQTGENWNFGSMVLMSEKILFGSNGQLPDLHFVS